MSELSAEDRRIRAQRARAVIEDAGWAFDEYVTEQQKRWINASDDDHGQAERDRAWRNVHVALSLKAQLILTINRSEDEEALREHRERTRPE